MASNAIRTIGPGIIVEVDMRLLDEVRLAAEATAAGAHHVHIRTDAIRDYSASLPLVSAGGAQLDPATHFAGPRAPLLAYVVCLDAINFGSGYFPRLRKRPGLSGYFTVASGLKEQFEHSGAWSAAQLQELTTADCRRIFGQDGVDDAAVDELMRLFSRALNDLGAFVQARCAGSFDALVSAASGSAEQLAGLLVEMPFYRDIGFYKRAQLTASDLSIAGVARFDDLARLTIFADNLVPHVLRLDGVLDYTPELLGRIQREELIPAGSTEEIEIRACALHAVELIRQSLATATSMQLDSVLWNRGQQPRYKAEPRHRTRTVFY
jgi:hypothetical protein